MLWPGSKIFLVLFAAVLLAVFINAIVSLIPSQRSEPSLILRVGVILLLVFLMTLFFVLIGPGFGSQMAQLTERLPLAIDRLQAVVTHKSWWTDLQKNLPLENLQPDGAQIMSGITGIFSTTMGAMTNMFLTVLIGFYIAIQPQLYLGGFLHLVPKVNRDRARQLMRALNHALSWWMLGRLASMVVVGVLTTAGLMLIDMPLALVLGVIAGLFAFVPYIGPIASAVPAILLGLLESPLTAGYVIAIYTLVQFIEGNFLTPWIQRRAVALAPAVLLTMQFSMGLFYGLFGVLIATPLAVVAIVTIQILYVQNILGDPVRLLGEHSPNPK